VKGELKVEFFWGRMTDCFEGRERTEQRSNSFSPGMGGRKGHEKDNVQVYQEYNFSNIQG
jgi:hypothetical protein